MQQTMKNQKKAVKKMLVSFFTLLALFFVSSFCKAQDASFAKHAVIDNEQPIASANEETANVRIAEATSLMNEVNIIKSSLKNNLILFDVNTSKGKLLTAIYDENGIRVTHEIAIQPGKYRFVDQTRGLKPGTYFMYVKEDGKVIEREKFVIN
jgi:hypothetical protein